MRQLSTMGGVVGGVLMLLFFGALGLGAKPGPKDRAPTAKPAKVVEPPLSLSARQALRGAALRAEPLPEPFSLLVPLAVPKLPSEAGMWLAEHREAGQTLASFQREVFNARGKTIYLMPVGLAPSDEPLFAELVTVTSAWFGLPVKRLPPMPKAKARRDERQHETGLQWFAPAILDALTALRPKDAAAVMAVTSVDLYPDPDWNFVFGEASYENRVGVTSLHRIGQEAPLRTRRALLTTVHELGHMLGVDHCLAWECAMNGSNSLEESDTNPLKPCPHCLAKLQASTGMALKDRWRALQRYYERAGLEHDAAECRHRTAALP